MTFQKFLPKINLSSKIAKKIENLISTKQNKTAFLYGNKYKISHGFFHSFILDSISFCLEQPFEKYNFFMKEK